MSRTLAVTTRLFFGLAIATGAAHALAQGATWTKSEGYRSGGNYPTPTFAPTPPNAIQHHASTAREGELRGASSLSQAQATAAVLYGQARVINAAAQAREYENRVRNTETFFAREQLLDEAREKRVSDKLESQERNRARVEEHERTVLFPQYRLNPDQLDHRRGEIYWPEALTLGRFEAYRQRIQRAYYRLPTAGVADRERYANQIDRTVEEFRDALRSAYRDLGLSHQANADLQKFLLGLSYEAKFWTSQSDAYAWRAERVS